MWNFPNQGLNPRPLQWKFRILTIGPTGKYFFFFFFLISLGEFLKRGQAELGSWDNQEITMSKKFCFFKIFIYLASPGPVCIVAGRIFSSGMQTLSCSMWDLVPRPGIEPRSHVLGTES